MKKLKNSTDHFTAREREALNGIRKQLTREIQPLLVLYLGSLATTTLRRNLSSIESHATDFRFSCELLVVLPEENLLLKSRSALRALERRLTIHADVRLMAMTSEGLTQQLSSERNMHISLHSQAIVLHEKDHTLQKIVQQMIDKRQGANLVIAEKQKMAAPPVTSVL